LWDQHLQKNQETIQEWQDNNRTEESRKRANDTATSHGDHAQKQVQIKKEERKEKFKYMYKKEKKKEFISLHIQRERDRAVKYVQLDHLCFYLYISTQNILHIT
jgi:hypothetical protein